MTTKMHQRINDIMRGIINAKETVVIGDLVYSDMGHLLFVIYTHTSLGTQN